MSITLYGIKNCDKVRAARKWLSEHNIDHRYHDYRDHGLTREQLTCWSGTLGWKQLLNRSGTTWRQLPDASKDGVDENRAINLMLDSPAMIKRPLLQVGKQFLLGFDQHTWGQLLHHE